MSRYSFVAACLLSAGFFSGHAESSAKDDYVIPTARLNHWAWAKPSPQTPPEIRNRGWAKGTIDAFILSKLEAAKITPAETATRLQLIRRVTFDLTGLPPTPSEIESFVCDTSPNAWEIVIDRLLASPHYGERWGRHWLDLARYADSNGYEHDELRPNAWRYRDYVVRAFNADKPFDRFILEQLAGDELFPDDLDARIATGFNLLGPDMSDSSDQVQRRQNTLNDMTDTAALAFLGMTMACARCHDHKFEPIPQSDYYRLQAFFTPAKFRSDLPVATKEQQTAHDKALREYQSLIQPTLDQIAVLEEPHRKRIFEKKLVKLSEEAQEAHRTPAAQRTGGQQEIVGETARLVNVSAKEIADALDASEKTKHARLREQLKQFDSKKPAPLANAMGLQDAGSTPPKTFLLVRGEITNRADEVAPGMPIILRPDHKPAAAHIVSPLPDSTGRRSTLARWIASDDNPLTARVLVNRLWQHHFGRGLVHTASDFGVRGEQPTHQELLDWLANDFVKNGWSIKQMHKLILQSATYQQSTKPNKEALEHDPDNLLFSRMNRQRLEGEIVRDSLLAISVRLNESMGGPGVSPPIPAAALQGFKGWVVSPNPRDHVRRSVYVLARRNLRFPFLEAFDLPDSNLSCPRRERSTTAPQALALLNADEIMAAAQSFAERLQNLSPSDDQRIKHAFEMALGRPPSPVEFQQAHEFLRGSPLRELCRALFNVNEFVYVD